MFMMTLPRRMLQNMAALCLSFAALNAHAVSATPGEGVKITPIFPPIAEERFRGEIALQGLRELGYKVQEPKETDYGVMMMALANGDADFTVHFWEKLHEKFYEQAGGDDVMVKTGEIMPNVINLRNFSYKYHIISAKFSA